METIFLLKKLYTFYVHIIQHIIKYKVIYSQKVSQRLLEDRGKNMTSAVEEINSGE
jgi:hypothetical protein